MKISKLYITSNRPINSKYWYLFFAYINLFSIALDGYDFLFFHLKFDFYVGRMEKYSYIVTKYPLWHLLNVRDDFHRSFRIAFILFSIMNKEVTREWFAVQFYFLWKIISIVANCINYLYWTVRLFLAIEQFPIYWIRMVFKASINLWFLQCMRSAHQNNLNNRPQYMNSTRENYLKCCK